MTTLRHSLRSQHYTAQNT